MAFVFPVIGKTEWSGGSWMPNTQTHRGRTHAAVDIYAARGQTIVSPVGGTIKNFGSGNVGGNWIQVQGDDGNVYYFAHMDQPVTLEKGQRIQGGSAIGLVGNTGSASSTSPHVHFSVKRDGKAISPVDMLRGGTVVPDLEFEVTGVEGGSGTPVGRWQPPDWADVAEDPSESLPAGAQDQVPAWFDQLTEYRQNMLNSPQENPTKIKARRVMQGTLQGMASMVRSAGFASSNVADTGIDEGNEVNVVNREGSR